MIIAFFTRAAWMLTQWFLSFIFAVLLSITVHFIALRLGRAIMHQHIKILLKSGQMFLRYRFSKWPYATMLKSLKGQNFI